MIDITNTTKGKYPNLPFEDIADKVLGKEFDLSLVFVGTKRSRALNKKWRNKDNSTNILSFPLSKTEGEIFIDIRTASKQAPKFDRTLDNFIGFLFIHGIHHLKGYEHGSTMEYKEIVIRKIFNI